ncbi:SOUL family heme-binding protein [Elioraea thermophila]|uniref:SOUL family heme-binding protein n=1 Tax=Elioraea thermophila TaxID=2185104 RepID=UPI001E59D579|nr:heme-binding protein [Elioraea thermophila]
MSSAMDPMRIVRAASAAAGLFLSAACSVVGARSTEEPAFTVIARGEGFEVRRYGPRLAAEVVVAGDPVSARNAGFRPLADYIFGANRARERIGMTAPVAQGAGERIGMTAPVAQTTGQGGWAIRFFMPARYTRETLPEPLDARVRIVELPEALFAVRRFAGTTGAREVEAETQRLFEALRGSAWRPAGEPEAWFFDPPWTIPALRRNEVAIPVAPAQG